MYEARTPPGKPPCDTCRVDLMDQNKEAAEVYMLTKGQVITRGMDGQVVDVSIPAVKIAMDLLGVVDQRACLAKVRKTFFQFLAEAQAKSEADQ